MSQLAGKGRAITTRDSLELASLASSSQSDRASISSDSGPPSSRSPPSDSTGYVRPATKPSRPGHNSRNYSVSSAFDFAPAPLALTTPGGGYAILGSSTRAGTDAPENLEKHKSLTYTNGLSLIIGLIIGSGIFSSPAQVNINAGSRGAALVVWAVAGLLAWTGAASFAELGGAIPLNGGPQVYLTQIYGEWAGFLFTWCAITVLKPGSGAIVAIIFGDYLVKAIDGAHAAETSYWVSKGIALLGVWQVTLIICTSTKLTTKSVDMLMIFKFLALAGVTIVGLVVAATGKTLMGPASSDWKSTGWLDGTKQDAGSLAIALYAGLWAYDGWDNTSYVVGEFINPRRDLPRTIHTSLAIVVVAYLLANLSYFFVLPLDVANSSNTIGVAFAQEVFGPAGGVILALVVACSCFGSLVASTFTTGRLVYGAGRQGYLPLIFGQLGFGNKTSVKRPRNTAKMSRVLSFISDEAGFFQTPIYAQLLNAFLTSAYVVVGDFATLTTFYGVAMYIFYFATVLGLIVLRVREPDLDRPYKCWLVTPIIFCCVSLFLLSRSVFARPLHTAVVLAFLTAGIPLYWWRVGSRRGKPTRHNHNHHGWRLWRYLYDR